MNSEDKMAMLTSDHYSASKRSYLYAAKGERVGIIADHQDVIIVEGSRGRFSVRREKLRII